MLLLKQHTHTDFSSFLAAAVARPNKKKNISTVQAR
jgi:hypothetical protein